MAKERVGVRGNKQLAHAYEIVAVPLDAKKEFIKCKLDPIYFVKTYMKIRHPDRGIIPFHLWPWQEKMLQLYKDNRFVISRIARQSGKCFTINTTVNLRNKRTGEIKQMTVGEFYGKMQQNQKVKAP